MNIFYVYEHWRLDREECFYVGKGHGNRAYQKGRNSHWKNIVSKLERIGSGYEIRLVATGLLEKEAFCLEIERIAFWRDKVDLANLTNGGEGPSGARHSAETKKKMSESRKGKKHSGDWNINISESHKGIRHTEETREKLSRLFKGRKTSDETKKKLSLFSKGRRHTEEVCKIISEARKKAGIPEHVRIDQRKALTGRKRAPFSEETKRKMSESAKIREQLKRERIA